MNPRNGGNYTEPEKVRHVWGAKETIEYVSYVGGVEISRWDNPYDAEQAVIEGLQDAGLDHVIEIHTSNVQEVEEHATAV